MKKLFVFIFTFLITSNYPQTNISPQFSGLKGMEDQQGNTHLFYRIYSYFENPPQYQWSNHIYHWDVNSEIDTLFLRSSGHEDPIIISNNWVVDVDYWNNNPDEFIYTGGNSFGPFFEGNAYIKRFDGYENYFGGFWGTSSYIDISLVNDSLLYAGIITDGGMGILKSYDGGRTWDSLSADYQFLSLNPHNENIFFVEDEDRELFRTTDSGNSFHLVYPEFIPDTRIFFDPDGLHIYRKTYDELIVSDNLGEQFSWEIVFTKSTTNEFYFSNDISVSGNIYVAENKNIFVSTDYGNNFNLYKSLDRNIVGIYKKPNSDKLYAATKYKIYEITPDTIQIVKYLPIPDEVFNYYPLAIGNHWVYSVYTNEGGNNIYWGDETRTIVDNPTNKFGSEVFLCERKLINGNKDSTYLELDSLTGKLYASSIGYGEFLFYEDLLAEAGDTVCYQFNPVWNCQFVQPDSQFTEFGLNTIIKKYFPQAPGWYFGHSLVQGIGLYEVYNGDLTTYQLILKGCIIDGVVYGDTTVVSVDDEITQQPIEFSLSQNYPNPFNPSTTIKFTIPNNVIASEMKQSALTTLKVYDVLGNEVASLVNENKPAGEYEIEFDAARLPSGVYFYQLKSGSFIQSKKMVLLK